MWLTKFSYLIFFFLLSCSSIEYKSLDVINVYMGHHPEFEDSFEVEGKIEFYLWGMYTGTQTVLIDHELKNLGAIEASLDKIEEYQTTQDFLFTLFTFGLYKSVHYKLFANGVKVGNE